MTRTLTIVVASIALSFGAVTTASSAGAVPAKKFQNCTQLNKTYPHGVGRPGARDKTSGTPVKNFKADKKVYNENTKSDRDKDGIACEKK